MHRPPAASSVRHLHLSEALDGISRVDGYLDGETIRRFARVLDVETLSGRMPAALTDVRCDLVGGGPLAIRDGGCTEPGCTAPPEWCDAHHEVHWAEGGPTDLSNLRLTCRRHHVAAHRRRGPPERARA